MGTINGINCIYSKDMISWIVGFHWHRFTDKEHCQYHFAMITKLDNNNDDNHEELRAPARQLERAKALANTRRKQNYTAEL